MANKAERVLLQNSFSPTVYSLTIEPDLKKFVFNGDLQIMGAINQETTQISLHAREIAILSVKFVSELSSGNEIPASNINFHVATHVVDIIFKDSLPLGAGSLHIIYVGQLNNQLAGFYRSGYTDAQGNKKVMASTQFEPLDARRALPCIDEPAVKVSVHSPFFYLMYRYRPCFVSRWSFQPS